MNTLEVDGLTKTLKSFTLSNISFTLPQGYIMGYIGQNGAGKTTTLKLITNLFKPDAGTIRIEGITCAENPIAFKNSIGFIGDEFYFPSEFKQKDVIAVLSDFYPSFDSKKFLKLMNEWNLPEDKRIGEYSKGMKVKLMFAAVFSRNTKLLILDEATNGLDPVMRSEVLELLQEYISDGQKSVLFSTHIMEDLEHISDYIFFIDQGKKVFCNTKDSILENYVILKGGMDELKPSLKEKLIGYTAGSVGFRALLSSKDLDFILPGMAVEKPTIDQIVVHYIKNLKHPARSMAERNVL